MEKESQEESHGHLQKAARLQKGNYQRRQDMADTLCVIEDKLEPGTAEHCAGRKP